MPQVVKTSLSRMFSIEDGAGPANPPDFQGFWKAGAVSWAQGDITPVRKPNPNQYDSFVTIDTIPGEQGLPELTVTSLMEYNTLSDLLALTRKGCSVDLQVHIGVCQNPQNFNGGWDKVLILASARPTNYGTGDLGALDTGERAVVNEEVPFSGQDYYELGRILLSQKAAALAVREVVDIHVCDSVNCGLCGLASDGCKVVFAVAKSSDASPGLVSELIWTQDGGLNWNDDDITTLTVAEDPTSLTCVGVYVVVVSQESGSLHYALINDILEGSATWLEVTTGFVGGGEPRKIMSIDPTHTWIVGAGGYVYFASDPTSGVSVQDAGAATTQQLNAIHGIDNENLVAVGNSNAVIFTADGGTNWSSVTGPAVGVNLNAVWMVSANVWWVGTAGGRLYYTINAGSTWVEKSFPGSAAGSVRDIVFSTPSVGWMAHSTATPAGRILRTIDGGYSWYVAPEEVTQSIPANDYIGALAACVDPNKIFGGGLGDDAVDGIIVQGGAS